MLRQWRGILNGYPTQGSLVFKPDNGITRTELTAILSRLIEARHIVAVPSQVPEFADAAEIPPWARAVLNTVVGAGIVTGYPDATFRPAKNITRAEAASIILRLLEKTDQTPNGSR